MGDVFANSREVSGKATPNKSIAAFPSVCLSPPSPPAGPIPIPYPVTSMSSDTNDGTGSVIIKKKEVGHKNGSIYKKCNGNQPATKSFGMDVLSHTLEGKTKFAAYSFDVMFEKDGAERFMDLTTGNHMNAGGAPMLSAAKPAPPYLGDDDADCAALRSEVVAAREDLSAATSNKGATNGTISSFAVNGASNGVKASNQLMRAKLGVSGPSIPDNYGKTIRDDDGKVVKKRMSAKQKRKARASELCGGGFTHPSRGSANHTEAQAVDSISWSPAPKTLTFAIDYPARQSDGTTNEKKSNWPCTSCKRVLQKACDCDVEIVICVDGEKKDFCKGQKKP